MIGWRKNTTVNICLALISFVISFTFGYYIYTNVKKTYAKNTPFNVNEEYQLSLFNRKGQKLSEPNGMFKLVIDPFTIFNNYPNQKSQSYSINEYGFRDSYTSDKPYSAIVLGGSAAFGWLLDHNEKTFSSQLSRLNPYYNIINGAVVAFLSSQELAQMVHYLDDFRPALYIVFNGWNDIHDPYMAVKSWPATYTSFGFQHMFLDIENRLAEYFKATQKDDKSRTVSLDSMKRQLNEKDFFQEIVRTYTTNISKMHSFASSRNAKFLVVFQPELSRKKNLSEIEQKILTAADQSPYEYLQRKIPERYKSLIEESKKIFTRQKIAFIDINDQHEFCENPETLFYDVVHPNAQGHEIIAKILHTALMENFH